MYTYTYHGTILVNNVFPRHSSSLSRSLFLRFSLTLSPTSRSFYWLVVLSSSLCSESSFAHFVFSVRRSFDVSNFCIFTPNQEINSVRITLTNRILCILLLAVTDAVGMWLLVRHGNDASFEESKCSEYKIIIYTMSSYIQVNGLRCLEFWNVWFCFFFYSRSNYIPISLTNSPHFLLP